MEETYLFSSNQPNLDEIAKKGAEGLGGKGFGLVNMCRMGLPVPEGIIIPTAYCVEYLKSDDKNKEELLNTVMQCEVIPALKQIRELNGYLPMFSVRSGARVSMPGMMDTILNVGLVPRNLHLWIDRMGEQATLDCGKRLINMMADVVHGVKLPKMDVKSVDDLETLTQSFQESTGKDFPTLVKTQIRESIKAVWESWNSPRAIEYRKINDIPNDWGTAVVIQKMVFGNMSDKSCSGVIFTRDPDSGESGIVGEYLVNAQGEDVVAGTVTPDSIDSMIHWDKTSFQLLAHHALNLDKTFRDMQDIEFTVEDGKLYILQTRSAKRSPLARFVTALKDHQDYDLSLDQVRARVSYKDYLALQVDHVDHNKSVASDVQGIPASGGACKGYVAFCLEDMVDPTKDYILVAYETTPNDIAAMAKAVGVLTEIGGKTSHSALVSRSMGKHCVVGCTDLAVNADEKKVAFPGADTTIVGLGEEIVIEGSTGHVWAKSEDVVVVEGSIPNEVADLLQLLGAEESNAHVPMGAGWYEVPEYNVAYRPESSAAVIEADKMLGYLLGIKGHNETPTHGKGCILWGTASNPYPETLKDVLHHLNDGHDVVVVGEKFLASLGGAEALELLVSEDYEIIVADEPVDSIYAALEG